MAEPLASLAETYAVRRTRAAGRCAEAGNPTELELQALWQDPHLRPTQMALSDGTPIEVLEVGRWNRSLGPDFRDALITVGGLLRRGDVELHLRPSDWDAHGHAGDPAYEGLILHVVWQGGAPAKTLPEGVPTLVLKPFFPGAETFDFSTLTPAVAACSAETPCRARLAESPGEAYRLAAAAGAFRLQCKAKAFAATLAAKDAFQTFYEGLLAAMGYGRNAATFRRLAEEVPFARLAALPSRLRFAVLAGVSGLLREESRELWDLWWQSGFPPALTPYAWDLRAMRPANHPVRRLAGAVGVLGAIAELLELPLELLPERLTEASRLLCCELGLKAAPIGANRANALVVNLFVPYRLALGTLSLDTLPELPSEDLSMPIRETWRRLTGSPRAVPKDGLRQQGLLQIYADFCNNPHIVCDACPVAVG